MTNKPFYYPGVEKMYLLQRDGSDENPFLPLTQTSKVKYARVDLAETPNFENKVSVVSLDGTPLIEVFTTDYGENEFLVDYSKGFIRFHPSQENNTFEISYLGIGRVNIPANRITIDTDESNEAELSVQELLDTQGNIGERLTNAQNGIDEVENLITQNQVVKNTVYQSDMNNVNSQISSKVNNNDFNVFKDATTAQLAQIDQELSGASRIIDLEPPQYLAHRGSALIYPENTLEAFKMSELNGNTFIELDVRQDRNGSLCVIHDEETIRVTGVDSPGSDQVRFLNTSYIRSKKVKGLLPNYPEQPIPYLDEVFQTFGNKVNYAIESKDLRSTKKIADLAEKYKLKDHVLIQSFDFNDLLTIKDRGFELLYISGSITDADELLNNNIRYVGCSTNVSDEYIQTLSSAGLKVIVYTVNHKYLTEKYLSLGAFGVFSDDPFYISNNYPIRPDSPYYEGVFSSGFIPHYHKYRGGFEGSAWGFIKAGIEEENRGRNFVLQGWAGELPTSFTLTFIMNVKNFNASGWASIPICTPIDYFDDNLTTLSEGYHLLIRADRIQIYKVIDGYAERIAETLGSVSTNAWLDVSVTINMTSITLVVGGLTVSVDDVGFRNGNFHFGRRWAEVLFDKVRIK